MKKVLITILLVFLGLTACRSDDMAKAAQKIEEANDDLKKVKAIYRGNLTRASELEDAMKAKDVDKVKSIADDLVLQISDGLSTGQIAVDKIKEAEAMNINETYREYLRLKRESLEKHLEAFEYRRLMAKQLSEVFGRKDPKEMDAIQANFREKEENFQKLIGEGKDLSQQANQIAKDATKR